MSNRLRAMVDTKNFYRAVVIGVIVTYLVLSFGNALTKRPWSDEGRFANAAWNLATRGSMGTTVLEPTDWLKGINQYTYWVMPLYLVTQAGWYKIFGFGMLSLRAFSVAWGLLALGSLFLMMKILSGDQKVALLTFAFLAVDYVFISGASFGRMEMMCAALGFAALASYLWLRERNFSLAVLISHALVAASGLTHFLGVMPLAGLVFLTLYFDRSRIRWRHLAIAALPYSIGAVGWGLYILQAPSLFITQFRGNANDVGRLNVLTAPWTGLQLEITKRYLVAFGWGPHSAGHAGPIALKMFILLAYVVAVAGAVLTRGLRQHRGVRALLVLTAIYFCIMTMLDGQKITLYLAHIIPLYAAILAVWVRWCWVNRLVPKWMLALSVCGFIFLQVGGLLYRMRTNSYRDSYVPAVNFLKDHAGETALIMGSADLGFDLGFDRNLVDDARLGYHSGKRADFIVVEEVYEDTFKGHELHRPEVHQHVTKLLEQEYRVVYDHAFYKIYARQ